jgi:hypothetical protein
MQVHLTERINGFIKLGDLIRTLDPVTLETLSASARNENPWFTENNIANALTGISKFLTENTLTQWTSRYDFHQVKPKTIGIVMAGNIPLVGFHDLLAVLISGHSAQVKLSSKDTALFRYLTDNLIRLAPAFTDKIQFQPGVLKNIDAVIATGSDNSARQFEYYFSRYPHIIRKNRTSCAILTGHESNDELTKSGDDIFSYFGMGCRNVSKLYVPDGYDFTLLLNQWKNHHHIIQHHKYANNYDYQKAIVLVNQLPFLDTGFVLLQENEKLVSPIAVLYYEYYSGTADLNNKIQQHEHKIQCIVGNVDPATVRFGEAQHPEVWDYADNVDTLKFLTSL